MSVPTALSSPWTSLVSRRFGGGVYERTVSLNVVQFDGILTVSDSAAFLRALSGGIGKAKAYGLGLLSVGPAGSSV